MAYQDFVTAITCAGCGAKLVRVPQAVFPIPEIESDPAIICTSCGAVGAYEEVIKQGSGLIGGLLTEEQRGNLVEKLRVTGSSP